MYSKIVVLSFFLALHLSGITQNVIPNGNVESNTCCPAAASATDNGQLITCAVDWRVPGTGTSDYWNTCGATHLTAAANPPQLPPPSGQGYLGMYIGFGAGYNEFAGVCLTSSLTNGSAYSFTFRLGSGSTTASPQNITLYGATSCSHLTSGLGGSGTDCPSTMSGNWVVLGQSGVMTPNSSSWLNGTINFTAPSNISAVIIGGSCTPTSSGDINNQYYFFDDLSLIISCTSGTNTTSTASICENGTKTLTASAGGGTWSIVSGGGSISGSTYTPPNVSSNTNVTVRYTDACGTPSDRTFTVNVRNVANNTTSTASICENSTKALTGTPGGGTWSVVSGGGSISGSTYTPPNVSSNTNVTVRYTIPANGACPATTSDRTFTVNVRNVANNTTSTAAICEGGTKALTGSPGGGTWSIVSGGGSISGTTYTSPSVASNTNVTVRYTIPANGACPATTSDRTFTVNDFSGTASNTTSTASICETSTKALTGTPGGGTWSVVSGGGSISGSTYTPANVSSNTSVTVRYTIAASGSCPASTSDRTFTVNNQEVASNTTSTAAICETGTKALTGSPGGGTWSIVSGGGSISGTTYTPANVSSNTSVTVRYTIAANGSCPATTSDRSFTVNPFSGTASNTTSTAAICETGTKALTGTPGGGTWSVVSGGGSISGSTYTPANVSSNTSVTVRYTVAATGSCPASTSDRTFTVNNQEVANNTTSTTDVCETGTKALTGTPGGGTWSVISGGGSISGSTYTPANVTTNTTATIRYTIAANGACPATTSDASFTINNQEIASNTTDTSRICETGTKTISGVPSGGTWTILTGGGSISGSMYTPTSVSANTLVTLRYEVAANGACIATTSDTSFIVNDNLIPANTTNQATICETDRKILEAIPSGGTWGIVSGGGSIVLPDDYYPANIANDTSVTIRYTTPGNGACPSNSDDATFIVQPLYNPTVAFDTSSMCINEKRLIEGSPSGGYFTVLSGPGSIGISGDTLLANGAGTIQFEYDYINVCGVVSDTHSVVVNPSPNPVITSPDNNLCEGSDRILTATPTGGVWSVIGGIATVQGDTLVANDTLDVTIQYTATLGSCSDSTTQTIFILPSPDAPIVSASDSSICFGNQTQLLATSSGSNVVYNVFDAPTGGTFYGQTTLGVSPTATTTYYVEALGPNNCPNINGRTPIAIVVNNLPIINAGADDFMCVDDSVNLIATGALTYVWSDGQNGSSVYVSPSNTATYVVTGTDTNGCQNTDTVQIDVQTQGYGLGANEDNEQIVSGELTTIPISANDSGDLATLEIMESPANGTATIIGIDLDYQSQLGYVGLDSLTYRICDQTCNNICDTTKVYLEVISGIMVPEFFSPNGDNINDEFTILGLELYPNSSIKIFNRWGSTVFEQNPFSGSWNGTGSGGVMSGNNKIPAGTYYYILDLGEDFEPMNGYFIVR